MRNVEQMARQTPEQQESESETGSKPRANVLADIKWVSETIGLPVKDQKKAIAPGAAARGLLNYANSDNANLKDFWRMWSRTMPSQKEIDAQGRFEDDGRDLEKLMDALDAASARQQPNSSNPMLPYGEIPCRGSDEIGTIKEYLETAPVDAVEDYVRCGFSVLGQKRFMEIAYEAELSAANENAGTMTSPCVGINGGVGISTSE